MSNSASSLPCLFRSQIRRVLSRDAETKIKLPLGVKLRSLTTSWWPERFKSRSPGRKQEHSVCGRGDLGCQPCCSVAPQGQQPLEPNQSVSPTCHPAPHARWEQPTCLHLPNLDLSIVESRGEDQAGDIWPLGMGAGPELLAGWRRPRAEGQTPYNLPTVQRLLLWATSSFCIILAASALGFKPSGDAGQSRVFLMSLKLLLATLKQEDSKVLETSLVYLVNSGDFSSCFTYNSQNRFPWALAHPSCDSPALWDN
jgi:hypothetical protein